MRGAGRQGGRRERRRGWQPQPRAVHQSPRARWVAGQMKWAARGLRPAAPRDAATARREGVCGGGGWTRCGWEYRAPDPTVLVRTPWGATLCRGRRWPSPSHPLRKCVWCVGVCVLTTGSGWGHRWVVSGRKNPANRAATSRTGGGGRGRGQGGCRRGCVGQCAVLARRVVPGDERWEGGCPYRLAGRCACRPRPAAGLTRRPRAATGAI